MVERAVAGLRAWGSSEEIRRIMRDSATAVHKRLLVIGLYRTVLSHVSLLISGLSGTELAPERRQHSRGFNPAIRSALRHEPYRRRAARYRGSSSSPTAPGFIRLPSRNRARIARRISSSDQRMPGFRRLGARVGETGLSVVAVMYSRFVGCD